MAGACITQASTLCPISSGEGWPKVAEPPHPGGPPEERPLARRAARALSTAGLAVQLEDLPAGELELGLGARTAQGATLYRGDQSVAVRAGAVVRTSAVLRYLGGSLP